MKYRMRTMSKKAPQLSASFNTQRPVPVARVFVFDRQGRLLLLRRANTTYENGRWCLPGGKIDYLDTPEKAAAREIKEETGLTLTGLEFLFYQNNLPLAPGLMQCINLYFRAFCRGKVRINEESSEVAWVTPEEALRYRIVFGGGKAVKKLIASGAI
jgi:8-oxo-dGTP diphosphatase